MSTEWHPLITRIGVVESRREGSRSDNALNKQETVQEKEWMGNVRRHVSAKSGCLRLARFEKDKRSFGAPGWGLIYIRETTVDIPWFLRTRKFGFQTTHSTSGGE